jgi:hypothetical protein
LRSRPVLILFFYRYSSYDNPHLGSDHGAELAAFFSPPASANADDLALFEAMREYWTSFVTTGVPVAKNSPAWKVSRLFLSAGIPGCIAEYFSEARDRYEWKSAYVAAAH